MGAAELRLNDRMAADVARTERVTIRTHVVLAVLEVLCRRCRLPYWRVNGVECLGAPTGGPRKRRSDP